MAVKRSKSSGVVTSRLVSVATARRVLREALDAMDIDDLAAAVSELGEYYGETVTVGTSCPGPVSWPHRKGVALKPEAKGGE